MADITRGCTCTGKNNRTDQIYLCMHVYKIVNAVLKAILIKDDFDL